MVYDLFAYYRTKNIHNPQPAVVYALTRETHDVDLAIGQQTKVQHGFSYSDGFGREIQKKMKAESGPVTVDGPVVESRWVATGWTIFNNNGKPVRQYEPFFTATQQFEFGVQVGVSPVLFYDPVQRVVAKLLPNHTYSKVIFDPWQQTTWDANDTVLNDPRTDADTRGKRWHVLRKGPSSFEVLPEHQHSEFRLKPPFQNFFYHDRSKTYFDQLYDPAAIVVKPFPNERVDFDHGAYASYNWEVFFHLPVLIATSLGKNQRFEDAMQLFHFVFNPMTDDPSASRQRFWNTLPFYLNSNPEHEQIQNLLLTLAGKKTGWKEVDSQIEEWRTNPFNPHSIARMRLTAYQKHVVMKYIDNLLAWADQLFSRDTLESINEATLLYVLAWNVLGPRPQAVATHHPTAPKSYHDIAMELDAFSNRIDPALLVKAKAAGLDLGSVLNDLFAPLPHYQFNVMLQKALELCNELKSLGGALLIAIEKRDAEAVSNLRASQETTLLKTVRDIKRRQIDEAKANIVALNSTRRTTKERYNYYRDIVRISAQEQEQLNDMQTAQGFNLISQGLQAAASAVFYIPTFTTGTSGVIGSPVVTVEVGGSTIGPAKRSKSSCDRNTPTKSSTTG